MSNHNLNYFYSLCKSIFHLSEAFKCGFKMMKYTGNKSHGVHNIKYTAYNKTVCKTVEKTRSCFQQK